MRSGLCPGHPPGYPSWWALIYVLETLSDIIQVIYFKATHGKRFFRMAPLHHHLELGGWSETKLFCVFSGATLVALRAGLPGRHEPISHVTGGAERFSLRRVTVTSSLRTGGGPRGPKTKARPHGGGAAGPGAAGSALSHADHASIGRRDSS